LSPFTFALFERLTIDIFRGIAARDKEAWIEPDGAMLDTNRQKIAAKDEKL